jgi:beta-glucosidase
MTRITSLALTGPGADYAAYGLGSGEIYSEYVTTPLEGMKRFIKDKADIYCLPWNGILPEPKARRATKDKQEKNPPFPTAPEITDAAKAKFAAAGAIIFFAIDKPHGEEGDLDNIELPGGQVGAIRALAAINPNIIVVLQSGQPVMLDEVAGKVPSILAAWYAGQETGDAIADIIFGKTNPSGKTTSTFARKMEDYPCESLKLWPPRPLFPGKKLDAGVTPETRKAVHAIDADYNEGVFIGYRWFDKQNTEPLFAFGHGLSYTKFALGGFKLLQNGNSLGVSCTVQNTGKRAGAEVVQIYMAPPKNAAAQIERPVRELKGFARVTLQPGETKRVEITLPPDALCRFDEKQNTWVTDPGEYTLEIGTSSRDIKARLPLQK